MTDREKLIELVQEANDATNKAIEEDRVEDREDAWMFLADYLIAHGVTVQECGGCDICNAFIQNDTLWKFCPFCGSPIKQTANGG